MTTFVLDTFTGSAGNLTGHTGETGATWTMDVVIGSGIASDMVLSGSGELIRAAATVGTSAAVPSGTVTGDFFIEMNAHWVSPNPGVRDGQIMLYDAGNNEVAEIGSNGNFAAIAGVGSTGFTPADSVDYLIRIESMSGVWTLKVDGATLLTGTPTSAVQPLSLALYDRNGDSMTVVKDYTIQSLGPPPPTPDFWTGFVASHEVP